eukprot:TRINITY_DN30279_c0_g1_i1.p1 TRINITY_DN30279_c0_g1~~TRINITY_DN30279_c0_g1_i1.p1  ORF type:complete len:362 (+),score=138.20 TRINITY_DN30279_c0_g1_i1:117-1202(+)
MLRRTGAALGVKLGKNVKSALKLMRLDARASTQEAKLRFRQLALKCHPDRNDGDDVKMKELNKAYTTVKQHLEEAAVRGQTGDTKAAPRKFEDREAKKEEVSLVQKLAKWMRLDEPMQDPTAEYKDYVRASEADKANVLGSAEEEAAYAAAFHADYTQRMGERRAKRGERGAAHDPWDPYSELSVAKRLENISMNDPMLYWALPQPEPELRLARGQEDSGLAGEIRKAQRRRNPQQVKKEKDAVSKFYNYTAYKLLDAERAAQRKQEHFQRKEHIRYVNSPAALNHPRILAKRLEDHHEANLKQLRLPGRSHEFIDHMGMRPPKSLRKTGQLITVSTKDVHGTPSEVIMSKAQFLQKGTTA